MLTTIPCIDTNLCMKGKIRAKGKCPKCSGKFSGNPLHCPVCLIPPKRYFIDLHWQGQRIRIFADKVGHPIDSWQRATRILEAIRYEIDQHSFDPSKYVAADVREFKFEVRVEAWYQSKLREAEKGILAKSYTRVIRTYIDHYYLPYFRVTDVRDIRTFHIQQFYDQLPQKSTKYTHNIMRALEGFFNTLHRQEFISSKPFFPNITLEKKVPRWVNLETQQAVLEAVPCEDRPFVTFLAYQGVRPGEARALKVKDINFQEGYIDISRTFSDRQIREKVKSKNGRPRLINPILLPMLQELCKNKFPEAFVFVNPRTVRPYTGDALYRIWSKVKSKINIDVTPYQATRHSLASIAASRGVPLQAIKDVLGHTDIRTTLKYAHTDLSSQMTVFAKYEEVLVLHPQHASPNRHQDKKQKKQKQ